jgi:hypothetical protein
MKAAADKRVNDAKRTTPRCTRPNANKSAADMAEGNFDDFYKDLKETEKRDAVLTPKQQIERLLRPGIHHFTIFSMCIRAIYM